VVSHSAWGVVAAVVVAALLLVAGVAKLARPALWHSQSAGMGVPWPVARVVPYVEVGLGAALLVQLQRHVIAWGAVALFASFTALLVATLAQGRRPPCACFGSLTSKPIGAGHVARNVVFMAIAVVAATL
jgi:uncharacterized membrane protein YphA (DoxX/SURF4 family)